MGRPCFSPARTMAQHPLGGGSCVEFCKQLYRKLCQFHSTTPPNLVYGRWLVLVRSRDPREQLRLTVSRLFLW